MKLLILSLVLVCNSLFRGFLELKTGGEVRVRVISNVLCDTMFVSSFKESQAGNLVQVVLLLLHDSSHVILGQAVRVQKLNQIVVTECLEWASVILSVCWRRKVDRLVAVPWLVIVALSFLAITMSDVVCIVLLKFLRVNVMLSCELRLPELERLFHRQSNSLEEESHLQTSEMLQMMLVLQSCHECLHARWE